MFPLTFNIEQEKQKAKIINVNSGQPIKTNGEVSLKRVFWKKSSKNITPREAEKKNIIPTANVRDITDSCLQYFLINTILHAKKKPAIIGKICKRVKFSDHGSKINIAPKLPKKRAKVLQTPILSPRKTIAKHDTKIGNVYKPAAIWAKLNLGDAAKKQNMHVVIIRARKYTGFHFIGISIEIPFVSLAIRNSSRILPMDLINWSCQKLVSLDMYFIKLSCNERIITPIINIVSDEIGLSFVWGFKKLNFTI